MGYNVGDVVHYYIIKVYEVHGVDPVEILHWKDLRWDLRLKYDWYFTYRAALLQVKYPKYRVDCKWGHEEAKEKALKQLLINKERAKRGKITEIQNKIQKAAANWCNLFPIEDDIIYKKAILKLERLKQELAELQNQLK
jgi:hypothetical protein